MPATRRRYSGGRTDATGDARPVASATTPPWMLPPSAFVTEEVVVDLSGWGKSQLLILRPICGPPEVEGPADIGHGSNGGVRVLLATPPGTQ